MKFHTGQLDQNASLHSMATLHSSNNWLIFFLHLYILSERHFFMLWCTSSVLKLELTPCYRAFWSWKRKILHLYLKKAAPTWVFHDQLCALAIEKMLALHSRSPPNVPCSANWPKWSLRGFGGITSRNQFISGQNENSCKWPLSLSEKTSQ